MLKVRDLHVYYGGIHALDGISIDVPAGKIVTLVGANGAGKSTTLRTIAGLVKPRSGSIEFEGKSILGLKAHKIVQLGISMAPEGRRVFPNLTVLENLKLGAYSRTDVRGVAEDLERVFELFPRLKERRAQLAGLLSGGEQQMLAVGRALMSRPRLLMMDEPSLGLAPVLVQEIFRVIQEIREQGNTILLIEQNAHAALSVADYGYVLESGRIVLEGPGKELLSNDDVRKAYLGEGS